MKKKILLLMGIFSLGLLQAQVGVNTIDPQAALDILSKGNTVSTKALVVKDQSLNSLLEVRDNGQFFTSGVTASPVLLDLRNGVDNSIIAMGNSTQTASAAKGGALKYDTNIRALYLSDGSTWNELASDYIKAFVVADITNASLSFPNNSTQIVGNWAKLSDETNSFNQSAGVFTALRGGTYSVSVNITLDEGSINANSELMLIISASGAQQIKSITTFYSIGNSSASVQCSGNFKLNLGETIQISLWHNLGSTKYVKLGYNNLTIVEM